MNTPIAYRYHSIEPEGLWTSETFTALTQHHIKQGVIAGYLNGRPRWACALDGAFIFGLDAKGAELKAAPEQPVIVEGLTERDGKLYVHDPRIRIPLQPEWGLRDVVPPTAPLAWGARAIYTHNRRASELNRTKRGTRRKRPVADEFTIDLLWDRQGIAWDATAGATEADNKAFEAWLNKEAMPTLRKRCCAEFITTDSDVVVEIEGACGRGKAFLKASPRKSCGYLYITAWWMVQP